MWADFTNVLQKFVVYVASMKSFTQFKTPFPPSSVVMNGDLKINHLQKLFMNEWSKCLQKAARGMCMLCLIFPSSYERWNTKYYVTSVSLRKKLES